MEKLVESFLFSKEVGEFVSKNTRLAYKNDLMQFVHWIGKDDPALIDEMDLLAYVASLKERHLAPATIARKISGLRQFFIFCCQEGRLQASPAENLPCPKLPQPRPHSLTWEQTQRLLEISDEGLNYRRDREFSRSRDRAMLYLLYATGIRVSELTSLTLERVDLNECVISVIGKKGAQRYVPFAPKAGEVLSDYFLRLKRARGFLFIHTNGKPLSRQSVWKIFARLAKKAGLLDFSPHSLRHSFATHMFQAGIQLTNLKLLLGHSSLNTTQIYAEVTTQHMREVHSRCHPRA
jgi:integrase/recombinase XerD